MCISRVGSEYFRRLLLDGFVSPPRFSTGKIERGHCPPDPGVERKDFEPAECEKHDAVGHFPSNSRKGAETAAQFLFVLQPGWRGEMESIRCGNSLVPHQGVQVLSDPFDIGNLGCHEGNQAFPGVLSQNPDSLSRPECGVEFYFLAKGPADRGNGIRNSKEAVNEFKGFALDAQAGPFLPDLEVFSMAPECESAVLLLPPEELPRVQGLFQAEEAYLDRTAVTNCDGCCLFVNRMRRKEFPARSRR